MKMKTIASLVVGALLLASGTALAAGFFTNGVPPAGGVQYPSTIPLTGIETVPADTNLPSGLNPASEAITTSQLKGYWRPPVTLTTDATNGVTINALQSELYTLAMAANKTLLNPINPQSGQVLRVRIQQDSTGSRTLSFNSIFLFPQTNSTTGYRQQPPLSTAINAVDLLTAVYDGVNWLASIQNLFR